MVNETINSMWFDCLLTHSNLEKLNIAQAAQAAQTLSIFLFIILIISLSVKMKVKIQL